MRNEPEMKRDQSLSIAWILLILIQFATFLVSFRVESLFQRTMAAVPTENVRSLVERYVSSPSERQTIRSDLMDPVHNTSQFYVQFRAAFWDVRAELEKRGDKNSLLVVDDLASQMKAWMDTMAGERIQCIWLYSKSDGRQ